MEESSLNNTKTMIEDLLNEDSKFIKQLDDLRHCSFARELQRVT